MPNQTAGLFSVTPKFGQEKAETLNPQRSRLVARHPSVHLHCKAGRVAEPQALLVHDVLC